MKRRSGRAVAALAAVMVATLSGAVLGAGTAQAVGTYVECPDLRPGAACGFEGAVGPGNVVVAFRYRKGDGSYGTEFYAQTCLQATCPVAFAEVPRPERTPAGYEVSSDSILTVIQRYPVI